MYVIVIQAVHSIAAVAWEFESFGPRYTSLRSAVHDAGRVAAAAGPGVNLLGVYELERPAVDSDTGAVIPGYWWARRQERQLGGFGRGPLELIRHWN